METDQTVYKYLTSNLQKKPKEVIDRFAHRIAVFSENPESLEIGEIQLKSKLWEFLDEAIHSGITTLYTGLTFGGDSAAAEFFSNCKKQNIAVKIVHIQDSPGWRRKIDPALRGYVSHTFIKDTDYSKMISKFQSNDSSIARDHFIIDQCLHIVFLTDFEKESEDSYTMQMLEYATSIHLYSISHQIHIISYSDIQQQKAETLSVPAQASLF